MPNDVFALSDRAVHNRLVIGSYQGIDIPEVDDDFTMRVWSTEQTAEGQRRLTVNVTDPDMRTLLKRVVVAVSDTNIPEDESDSYFIFTGYGIDGLKFTDQMIVQVLSGSGLGNQALGLIRYLRTVNEAYVHTVLPDDSVGPVPILPWASEPASEPPSEPDAVYYDANSEQDPPLNAQNDLDQDGRRIAVGPSNSNMDLVGKMQFSDMVRFFGNEFDSSGSAERGYLRTLCHAVLDDVCDGESGNNPYYARQSVTLLLLDHMHSRPVVYEDERARSAVERALGIIRNPECFSVRGTSNHAIGVVHPPDREHAYVINTGNGCVFHGPPEKGPNDPGPDGPGPDGPVDACRPRCRPFLKFPSSWLPTLKRRYYIIQEGGDNRFLNIKNNAAIFYRFAMDCPTEQMDLFYPMQLSGSCTFRGVFLVVMLVWRYFMQQSAESYWAWEREFLDFCEQRLLQLVERANISYNPHEMIDLAWFGSSTGTHPEEYKALHDRAVAAIGERRAERPEFNVIPIPTQFYVFPDLTPRPSTRSCTWDRPWKLEDFTTNLPFRTDLDFGEADRLWTFRNYLFAWDKADLKTTVELEVIGLTIESKFGASPLHIIAMIAIAHQHHKRQASSSEGATDTPMAIPTKMSLTLQHIMSLVALDFVDPGEAVDVRKLLNYFYTEVPFPIEIVNNNEYQVMRWGMFKSATQEQLRLDWNWIITRLFIQLVVDRSLPPNPDPKLADAPQKLSSPLDRIYYSENDDEKKRSDNTALVSRVRDFLVDPALVPHDPIAPLVGYYHPTLGASWDSDRRFLVTGDKSSIIDGERHISHKLLEIEQIREVFAANITELSSSWTVPTTLGALQVLQVLGIEHDPSRVDPYECAFNTIHEVVAVYLTGFFAIKHDVAKRHQGFRQLLKQFSEILYAYFGKDIPVEDQPVEFTDQGRYRLKHFPEFEVDGRHVYRVKDGCTFRLMPAADIETQARNDSSIKSAWCFWESTSTGDIIGDPTGDNPLANYHIIIRNDGTTTKTSLLSWQDEQRCILSSKESEGQEWVRVDFQKFGPFRLEPGSYIAWQNTTTNVVEIHCLPSEMSARIDADGQITIDETYVVDWSNELAMHWCDNNLCAIPFRQNDRIGFLMTDLFEFQGYGPLLPIYGTTNFPEVHNDDNHKYVVCYLHPTEKGVVYIQPRGDHTVYHLDVLRVIKGLVISQRSDLLIYLQPYARYFVRHIPEIPHSQTVKYWWVGKNWIDTHQRMSRVPLDSWYHRMSLERHTQTFMGTLSSDERRLFNYSGQNFFSWDTLLRKAEMHFEKDFYTWLMGGAPGGYRVGGSLDPRRVFLSGTQYEAAIAFAALPPPDRLGEDRDADNDALIRYFITTREFSANTDGIIRDDAVLNALLQIQLRDDQKKILQQMADTLAAQTRALRRSNRQDDPGVEESKVSDLHGPKIFELIMGYGKTKVITPYLVNHLLTGMSKNRIYIVTSRELVSQSYHLLLTTYGIWYRTRVNFTDDDNFSRQMERGVYVISDVSMKTSMARIASKRASQTSWAPWQVLDPWQVVFHTMDAMLIDEVDLLSDPQKSELNLPLTPAPLPSSDEIREKVSFWYKALSAFRDLSQFPLARGHEELSPHRFVYDIAYARDFASRVLRSMGASSEVFKGARDMLALIMTKRCAMDFAILPQLGAQQRDAFLCVPCEKEVPLRGSQFSSTDLTLAYSVYHRMIVGVTPADRRLYQAYLRKLHAKLEKNRAAVSPFQLQWQRFFPTSSLADEIDGREQVLQDESMRLAFIQALMADVVFPKFMRPFEDQMQVTFTDIATGYLQVPKIAFTGTAYMYDMRDDGGNEGFILRGIHENHYHQAFVKKVLAYVPDKHQVSPETKVEELLGLIKASAKNTCAVIDTAAFFLGLEMEKIAQIWSAELERPIIFWTGTEGRRCSDGKPSQRYPVESGSVPASSLVLFDLAHTTGIDLRLPSDGHAFVTLDATTSYRDLSQGVFRMRQISGEQTISYVTTMSFKDFLRQEPGYLVRVTKDVLDKKLAGIVRTGRKHSERTEAKAVDSASWRVRSSDSDDVDPDGAHIQVQIDVEVDVEVGVEMETEHEINKKVGNSIEFVLIADMRNNAGIGGFVGGKNPTGAVFGEARGISQRLAKYVWRVNLGKDKSRSNDSVAIVSSQDKHSQKQHFVVPICFAWDMMRLQSWGAFPKWEVVMISKDPFLNLFMRLPCRAKKIPNVVGRLLESVRDVTNVDRLLMPKGRSLADPILLRTEIMKQRFGNAYFPSITFNLDTLCKTPKPPPEEDNQQVVDYIRARVSS